MTKTNKQEKEEIFNSLDQIMKDLSGLNESVVKEWNMTNFEIRYNAGDRKMILYVEYWPPGANRPERHYKEYEV